jgi:hypothetical protein
VFLPHVDWTCHLESYVFLTMKWPCMNNVYGSHAALFASWLNEVYVATKTIRWKVLWFKVQTCKVSSQHINWNNEIHIYNINSIIHYSCNNIKCFNLLTTNVQCVKTKVGKCALKLWQGSKYNKYKWNEFKEINPCLEGANSFNPSGLERFDDVINIVLVTTKWVVVTSQTLIFFPKNRWRHQYM